MSFRCLCIAVKLRLAVAAGARASNKTAQANAVMKTSRFLLKNCLPHLGLLAFDGSPDAHEILTGR